jgi:hypothetical protein
MSPEARALANVLLNHHRQAIRRSREPLKDVNGALISYGVLCDRAGLSYRSRNAGPFLREIAEWCHDHEWPPINSLAVNHATRVPGG